MNHREEAVDWSRRYKANLEKLASQDLAKVAEVVRDLELRERQHGLSAGERRMLEKARHLGQLLGDADAGITHRSSDEARQLGHNYVSTRHILLSLIRDSDGVAGQVLATLGADLTTARQQVTELLHGYRGGDEPGTVRAARRSGKAGRGRRKLLSEILGRLDSMESRLRAIEHCQLPPEP